MRRPTIPRQDMQQKPVPSLMCLKRFWAQDPLLKCPGCFSHTANPLQVICHHQANLRMLIQETPIAMQIPRQRKEKTKERRARPMSLLKRKQEKAKKAYRIIELSYRMLKWKRLNDHKQEQRRLCSRWQSSRGKSMKKAEEGIRNFSFAWQNF